MGNQGVLGIAENIQHHLREFVAKAEDLDAQSGDIRADSSTAAPGFDVGNHLGVAIPLDEFHPDVELLGEALEVAGKNSIADNADARA